MSPSFQLRRDEVYALSGYRRPSKQIAWLRENGYKFLVRADGYPSVLRHKPKLSDEKMIDGLLTHDEIIRRSRHTLRARICGIYFLIHGVKVVYVGKSQNIMRRMLEHVAGGDKQFDHYYYIRCHKSKLDEMERSYIKSLLPGINVQRNWK